tara:strand:+ start:230 stop:988 length:759 start_codon:yes stop_codon:yes gene_type:complete
MSDGHFYNCQNKPYLTTARTPAQARKLKAYPSCTTILKIQKNNFLDNIWIPRQLVYLAREHLAASVEEIQDMKFGYRICPKTKEKIRSNIFGTRVHARLEQVINAKITGDKLEQAVDDYDEWVKPFILFINKEKIEPISCEEIVYCDKSRSAGSVDFIGKWKDKIHLFDYKCRDTKGTGGKFYEEKDCSQLAIECKWVKQIYDLDYMPMATSVCICTESKKHYHKHWNKTQLRKGVTRFNYLNKIYRMDWMK